MKEQRLDVEEIADAYFDANGSKPASLAGMAEWAIDNGFALPVGAQIKAFARALSDGMRRTKVTTPSGREVRKYIAGKTKVVVGDGKERQEVFWAKVDCGNREHYDASLRMLRRSVLGDCKSFYATRDAINEDFLKGKKPIQLSLLAYLDTNLRDLD